MLESIKVSDIIQISIEAGKKILEVYNSEQFEVEQKEDNSPLTLADRLANSSIVDGLSRLYPDIPILSEEGRDISYSERVKWEYFWLVDPLDGTKEFIKRNGEFTVNIALIHKGKSVLGVIYTPVLDEVYFAKEELGSYKLNNGSSYMKEKEKDINDINIIDASIKLPIKNNRTIKTVVASRSHMSAETEQFIRELENELGEVEIISSGSSLKLCLIAEGKADYYPRFAPTMEWDTAAGQAIVEQANGKVINVETNSSLKYNKENLLNPWFVVSWELN